MGLQLPKKTQRNTEKPTILPLFFLDGFGYDSQDNEEMMTNADIKKQGQQLMDFKRNKRRTKKRKS